MIEKVVVDCQGVTVAGPALSRSCAGPPVATETYEISWQRAALVKVNMPSGAAGLLPEQSATLLKRAAA